MTIRSIDRSTIVIAVVAPFMLAIGIAIGGTEWLVRTVECEGTLERVNSILSTGDRRYYGP
jgi:hypothetical protein